MNAYYQLTRNGTIVAEGWCDSMDEFLRTVDTLRHDGDTVSRFMVGAREEVLRNTFLLSRRWEVTAL